MGNYEELVNGNESCVKRARDMTYLKIILIKKALSILPVIKMYYTFSAILLLFS